ncbi:12935_t:CDS:1, partial [Cetraspora pellucida]
DIEFTLSSNKYIIDTLSIVRYINEDDVFESSEHENELDTFFVIKNANDTLFESNNPESESNILTVIRNVEDNIYKNRDSKNKSKNSPLKEIYTGQTFISFEILEQSLKHYSI